MKILFKRSNTATSAGTMRAGEPVWYKNDLYIGDVSTTSGTGATSVNGIYVGGATLNGKVSALESASHTHGNITLSKNAQTYATIGDVNYTISLPSEDPYTSARTPSAHAFSSHDGVTITSPAADDLLYYNNGGWKNGTFTEIFGGTPLTSVGTLNTNNTNAQTVSSSESFKNTINLHKISKTGSYNDLLNKPTIPTVNNAILTVQGTGLLGGTGTFTANASANKTINISHNTRTEEEVTDSTVNIITRDSNSFTTTEYGFDGAGHETHVRERIWEIAFPTADDLGLSNAMHFIGVLDELPTPTTSDNYKNGDVVLVDKQEYVRSGKTDSNAGTWVLLGDEGSYALKTISITGTGALSGGGSLSANHTITHNKPSVAPTGSYGPSGNATPAHGNSFNVPYVTVDEYGHVTAASTKTITLPAQYSHPTNGANTSAGPQNGATLTDGGSFTVPYVTVNNLGHVTAASTKTFTLPSFPTSLTPTSHTHGNINNTGTLTDTAAAPESGDYIVIRDASNKAIQTSTIDASQVSTLITNLHDKDAGGAAKPIYFNNGVPTACSSTVGGIAKPVYMNAGTITACSSTVGSTAKPVYMNAGTITASNATVGSSSTPVYMNAGTITECDTIDGGTF